MRHRPPSTLRGRQRRGCDLQSRSEMRKWRYILLRSSKGRSRSGQEAVGDVEACSRSGGEGSKRGKGYRGFGIATGISSMCNGCTFGVKN